MSKDLEPTNVVRLDFVRAKAGKGPEPTELRYVVGHVRSGHVQFVAVVPGTRRTVKFTVSPEEARKLGYDLLKSAGDADEYTKHLRGYFRFIVEPGDAPGVIFVRHGDRVHRWRETVIKKQSHCAVCGRQSKPGETMYQQAEFGLGDAKSAARWQRLCSRCGTPSVAPDIKPADAVS